MSSSPVSVSPRRDRGGGVLGRDRRGKSGIGPITLFDASTFPTRIAGEVKGFDPTKFMDRKEARRNDRFIQFALAAADMAMKDSGLDMAKEDRSVRRHRRRRHRRPRDHRGGARGLPRQGRREDRSVLHPEPHHQPRARADQPQVRHEGAELLAGVGLRDRQPLDRRRDALHRAGLADVMITGGCEATISPLGIGGFCAARAVRAQRRAGEASRPFDKGRDGFVAGEGLRLILEEYEHAKRRGADLRRGGLRRQRRRVPHHLAAPRARAASARCAWRSATRASRPTRLAT